MCGIAGILRVSPPANTQPPPHHAAIPEPWLDTLDDAIKHRGPNGQGRFRDRVTRPDGTTVDVALIHRRLSIIDHDHGHQPMVSVRGRDNEPEAQARDLPASPPRDPRPHTPTPLANPTDPNLIAVTFNGCIYNHRELRTELESLGHVFESDHSDTEVLLHGWREWGYELPNRLNAMYAFALWDRATADTFVARDRFGERPMYVTRVYWEHPDSTCFAFASTAAALARLRRAMHPGARATLSGIGVPTWIVAGCSDEDAPWHDIAPINAGTAWPLIAHEQYPETTRRVLAANNARRPKPKPLTKAGRRRSFRLDSSNHAAARRGAREVEPVLRAAVEQRLEADVPIACLLSGGLDSSLVATFAREALGRLDTVCVRMPDAAYDESEAAAEIARHIGADHHVVDASTDPAADLIHLIETLGLPFGDSSLLPTYWACLAGAEIAPVLLTGDGGDEMFIGYDRQMTCQIPSDIGPVLMALSALVPTALIPQRDPRARSTRLARFLRAARRMSYPSLTAIFEAPDAVRLLGRSASKPALGVWPEGPGGAAAYDAEVTLPADYLRKVDTAALAVPVETRAPFLDPRVAQAAGELGDLRLVGGRKGLLKTLARAHLPAHIIDRPKQGFAVPIGDWFRTDYGGMRTLLHDHLRAADPFPGIDEAGIDVNMRFVEQMLTEHDAAGEASKNPWHGRDHSQRLYMLLVLSIWCHWLRSVPTHPDPVRLDGGPPERRLPHS